MSETLIFGTSGASGHLDLSRNRVLLLERVLDFAHLALKSSKFHKNLLQCLTTCQMAVLLALLNNFFTRTLPQTLLRRLFESLVEPKTRIVAWNCLLWPLDLEFGLLDARFASFELRWPLLLGRLPCLSHLGGVGKIILCITDLDAFQDWLSFRNSFFFGVTSWS